MVKLTEMTKQGETETHADVGGSQEITQDAEVKNIGGDEKSAPGPQNVQPAVPQAMFDTHNVTKESLIKRFQNRDGWLRFYSYALDTSNKTRIAINKRTNHLRELKEACSPKMDARHRLIHTVKNIPAQLLVDFKIWSDFFKGLDKQITFPLIHRDTCKLYEDELIKSQVFWDEFWTVVETEDYEIKSAAEILTKMGVTDDDKTSGEEAASSTSPSTSTSYRNAHQHAVEVVFPVKPTGATSPSSSNKNPLTPTSTAADPTRAMTEILSKLKESFKRINRMCSCVWRGHDQVEKFIQGVGQPKWLEWALEMEGCRWSRRGSTLETR